MNKILMNDKKHSCLVFKKDNMVLKWKMSREFTSVDPFKIGEF